MVSFWFDWLVYDPRGKNHMRSFSLGLLALLALIGIAPTAAASDSDILRQFGMLGRQPIDCAAPASTSNPHMTYSVSAQGKITRTLKMQADLDGTFPVRNLRLIRPDLLQFQETGRQSELTITITKIAGKFRSWHSIRADGTVLIADGKFKSSGSPTLAFTMCRD